MGIAAAAVVLATALVFVDGTGVATYKHSLVRVKPSSWTATSTSVERLPMLYQLWFGKEPNRYFRLLVQWGNAAESALRLMVARPLPTTLFQSHVSLGNFPISHQMLIQAARPSLFVRHRENAMNYYFVLPQHSWVLILPPFTVQPSPDCRSAQAVLEGYQPIGRKYYKRGNKTLVHSAAVEECEAVGGRLVSFTKYRRKENYSYLIELDQNNFPDFVFFHWTVPYLFCYTIQAIFRHREDFEAVHAIPGGKWSFLFRCFAICKAVNTRSTQEALPHSPTTGWAPPSQPKRAQPRATLWATRWRRAPDSTCGTMGSLWNGQTKMYRNGKKYILHGELRCPLSFKHTYCLDKLSLLPT